MDGAVGIFSDCEAVTYMGKKDSVWLLGWPQCSCQDVRRGPKKGSGVEGDFKRRPRVYI